MQTEDILILMQDLAELGDAAVVTMDRAYVYIAGMRVVPHGYTFRPPTGHGAYGQAELIRHWERFLKELWVHGPAVPRTLVWRQYPAYYDGNYNARLCYVEAETPEEKN